MAGFQTEMLYLVDGRRVEGPPAGLIILTPPSWRARGRDERMLLLLVDLEGEAPPHLLRRLREVAATTFWSSIGSVTAALRQTVAAVNSALFQANLPLPPEERRYGGVACAALNEGEAFLAQAGLTWACFLSGGLLDCFPGEHLPPIGVAAYAEARLSYMMLQPGDRLLMGSRRLEHVGSPAVLQRLLSNEDVGVVLDGLEQLAGGEGTLSALLLCCVTAEAAEPAPLPEPPPPAEPAGPSPREVRPTPRPPRPARARARPDVRRVLATAAYGVAAGLAAAGRGVRGVVVRAGTGIRALFYRMLPGRDHRAGRFQPRPERRPPPPENPQTMMAIALGVLALVAIVTTVTWATYGSGLQDAQTLRQARQRAEEARRAVGQQAARDGWMAVLGMIEGIENNAEAEALRLEAQAAIDVLDGITWVTPTLLYDFGSAAHPRRLIAHGTALFVLDANGTVSRLTLNGERVEGEAVTLFRSGQAEVGDLVDMAWVGPGGTRTADTLLVLEKENSLVVYDPAWTSTGANVNHIYPGGWPAGATPVAMAAYEGRLYLLDPATDHLWRYVPQQNSYPNGPESYFADAAPDLGAARDLAIDGNVYILYADGTVEKYLNGQATGFTVATVPPPETRFIALAVNPERMDDLLLLADEAGERLVLLDPGNGAFRCQLRSRGGEFRALQALTLEPTSEQAFFVAGGRLYSLPPGIRCSH
jgi:hypothetical protein